MMKIAIIGECMVEISGEIFGQSLMQGYGGDTLNTAVYLKRLSPESHVQYVTALGKDELSQKLMQKWQEDDITTDHVLQFDHLNPGLYWIILDQLGERSFMYWRKQSAASQWLKHPSANEVLRQLMNVDWIYLSGISLAILDDNDRDKLITFLTNYRDQGGKIAFDSNYRPMLWQNQDKAQQYYRSILNITDLAMLTDEDEAAIWGLDISKVPEFIKDFQCPTIILKRGKNGAIIFTDLSETFIPTAKVDNVIDSTAAGDSFNAGVMAGIFNGLSIEDACLLGHQVAGAVIQHKGAIIPIDALSHIIK